MAHPASPDLTLEEARDFAREVKRVFPGGDRLPAEGAI